MYINTPHKHRGFIIVKYTSRVYKLHYISSREPLFEKGYSLIDAAKLKLRAGANFQVKITGAASKKYKLLSGKTRMVSTRTINQLLWLERLDLKVNPYD